MRAAVIGAAGYRWSPAYYANLHQAGFLAPGKVDHDQIAQWLGPAALEWVRSQHRLQPGPGDYWKALASLLSTPFLTPLPYRDDDLRGLTMPALILVGDRDEAFALEDLLAMYRLIPQAELAVIPAADHLFPWTRPAAFTSGVLDFLLRHRDAPATSGG